MVSTLESARIAADAAQNKKALDVEILDIQGLTTIADYFLICSATNITQIGAIADGIGHALAERGVRPSHIEGGSESTWVLMDYGDVIVHIFDEQTRSFYGLERLWGDAKRIRTEASLKAASS